MKYNENWKEKEKIIDNKIPERDKISKRFSKKHITGINLHDVLSIRNWLVYAKKINDESDDNPVEVIGDNAEDDIAELGDAHRKRLRQLTRMYKIQEGILLT